MKATKPKLKKENRMTINEAKQMAYSAANRARSKADELLRNPNHTLADAVELTEMADQLSAAAGVLVLVASGSTVVAEPKPKLRNSKRKTV